MFKFGPFSVFVYVFILLVTSRCPSALPVAGGTNSLAVSTDDVPPSSDTSHHPYPTRFEGSNLASELGSIWRRDTSMPGWDKIAAYAKEQWGDKVEHKVVTNDKHFPQFYALLCAPNTETVAVKYTGQPQCMTNNASSQGVLSGTSGSVSISVGQGYTVSSSFVLSSTTSAELFGSFTTMTTFPDITTSHSDLQYYADKYTCYGFRNRAGMRGYCFVAFEYTKKVKDFVHIDELLRDPASRTVKVTFEGPIRAKSSAAYEGACKKP
ncbi:hypothetical protein F5051DRAFT_433748 [Lentinula edodes]|nr:hypothetical protein F5051DRAFT_433748 [Lentinula edodes]